MPNKVLCCCGTCIFAEEITNLPVSEFTVHERIWCKKHFKMAITLNTCPNFLRRQKDLIVHF